MSTRYLEKNQNHFRCPLFLLLEKIKLLSVWALTQGLMIPHYAVMNCEKGLGLQLLPEIVYN